MAYNIIRKDISNGLKGRQISSMGAGNYLILRYAPNDANVKVQLGHQDAPYIDLIQDDSIEGTNVGNIYITADAVAGEHIVFAQAITSDEFKITPAPAVKNIQVDNFFMPKTDQLETILTGASYTLDTSLLSGVRFLATDNVDVYLNGGVIPYEMLEDEIMTRDITSLKFTNNTANTITLTMWKM